MDTKQLKMLVRESPLAGKAYLTFQRLTQPRRDRSAVFFPKELYSGTAADLRVRAVARELKSMGWRTIVVPPWLDLETRLALLAKEPNAVLFFHKARHEFNMPSFYPGRLCVVDADDADILHTPERFIECLQGCSAAIAGSAYLAELFLPYNPDVTVVWTGTYLTDVKDRLPQPARPVITWASRGPFDYPDECALMLRVWEGLARRGVSFTAAIYTNERERGLEWMAPLRELGVHTEVRPLMRYKEFVHSLTDVAVGLHPVCASYEFSRGKSFGKVLSYMAARVPIVASDEIDHRLFFRNNENGLLVTSDEEWIEACIALLNSPADRQRLADAAHADLLRRLTARRAAELVGEVLDRVLQRLPGAPAGRLLRPE